MIDVRKNSRNRFEKLTVLTFVLIAFPLHFLYSYLLVIGIVPSIPLIGYPVFTHFTSLIVLTLGLIHIKKFFNNYFYIFIFFIFQVFFYAVVGFLFSSYAYNLDAFFQTIILLYYIIVFSITGFSVYYYNVVGNRVWLYLLLLFLIIILYHSLINGRFYFYLHLINPDIYTINYQQVASIFLIVWYFYFAGLKKYYKKLISIIIAITILLASGSRSEFFGFLLSVIYLNSLSMFRINRNKARRVIYTIAVLIPIIFYYKNTLVLAFERSRHFSIISLDSDTSWQAREQLEQLNLKKIYESPILGDYASHFELGSGEYIHNILSSWQQFGLLGFILYALLVLIPFIVLSYFKVKTNKVDVDGYLTIATFSLILVLVSKSVFWPYIGLSIGAFLHFCYTYNSIRDD